MRRRDFLLALAGLWLSRSSPAGSVDFAPVLPGRRLVFPADHGAHPNFRTEWWYATGWLHLPDARQVGFQITFFRVRSGIGDSSASAFAPRQLILAHAAIADPDWGRLRFDQRSARTGFGRAGFATDQTRVWVDDWRLEQVADAFSAVVRGDAFSYALMLSPSAPPMLNGVAGFSRKAVDPRYASFYYSLPGLDVRGTLSVAGRSLPVSGEAWLDHEWSSALLPPAALGWDWVGVNLADGGALMAFQMRGVGGAALWSAASLRPAGGVSRNFAAEAVRFEPLRQWRSPRSGIAYPVEWRIGVGRRVFLLRALMPDQELDSRRSTSAIYWEGAVRLLESGREVGRGYLEMTGYGERIQLG